METAIIPQDQSTKDPAGIAARFDGKAPIHGVCGLLASALDAGGAVGEINMGGEANASMNQKGYTLVEVFVAAGIIFCVVATGLGVWVAVHFIVKFW